MVALQGLWNESRGNGFRTSRNWQVELLNATPDGHNINRDCGSTVPEQTAQRVAELGFDLGFAFDGDADRMILCDADGGVRNGDACLT